jgi:hypothetical protein
MLWAVDGRIGLTAMPRVGRASPEIRADEPGGNLWEW